MTPEEKKKAETAKAEAEAKAKEEADATFEAEIAELSDEDKEAKRAERYAKNTDNKIDYRAEFEKEKVAREAAEKALAEKRFKASERKRKDDVDDVDEGEDIDDDKPLTAKDIDSVLDRATEKAKKELQSERIAEISIELADGNADKAKYIAEIHRNRSFPSHLSLREQLEEATAIADRKKLISTNSELKRALNSKTTASKDAAITYRDGMEGTAPKLSAGDQAAYARAGFIFDTKERVYKKKLPSGKFLIKDPKTKATFTR